MKRLAIRQLAPSMALLFMLGVATASAGDFSRGGHAPRRSLARMLSRLDLTEAQKTEVRGILETRGSELEPLRDRLRADRRALRAAADAPSPNASAVGAAFLKVCDGRGDLRAERRKTLDSVRAVLTAEQRERLDSILQARKDRMQRRMARPGATAR